MSCSCKSSNRSLFSRSRIAIKGCDYWLVPVHSLDAIDHPTFDHAWILPDNSIWTLNHQGDQFIQMASDAAGHPRTSLANEDGYLTIAEVADQQFIINFDHEVWHEVLTVIRPYLPIVPNLVAGEGIAIDHEENSLIISNTFAVELFQLVDALPNDPQENMIYVLANLQGDYEMWGWIDEEWRDLGALQIDISHLVTRDDLEMTLNHLKQTSPFVHQTSDTMTNDDLLQVYFDDVGFPIGERNGILLTRASQDNGFPVNGVLTTTTLEARNSADDIAVVQNLRSTDSGVEREFERYWDGTQPSLDTWSAWREIVLNQVYEITGDYSIIFEFFDEFVSAQVDRRVTLNGITFSFFNLSNGQRQLRLMHHLGETVSLGWEMIHYWSGGDGTVGAMGVTNLADNTWSANLDNDGLGQGVGSRPLDRIYYNIYLYIPSTGETKRFKLDIWLIRANGVLTQDRNVGWIQVL